MLMHKLYSSVILPAREQRCFKCAVKFGKVVSLRQRTAVTNFVVKAEAVQLNGTLETVWETILINLTELSCRSRWLTKDWSLSKVI